MPGVVNVRSAGGPFGAISGTLRSQLGLVASRLCGSVVPVKLQVTLSPGWTARSAGAQSGLAESVSSAVTVWSAA